MGLVYQIDPALSRRLAIDLGQRHRPATLTGVYGMRTWALATMVASISTAAIAADSTVANAPLQPTGKWNVEYAEDRCMLAHAFGSADRQVIIGFRPLALDSSSMEINVISDRAVFSCLGWVSCQSPSAKPVTPRPAHTRAGLRPRAANA